MLEILGLFGKLFPESMYDKSTQLTTVFMECLQRQFKSQKPEMMLISSSIVSLTYFLTEFSGDFLTGTTSSAYNDVNVDANSLSVPKNVSMLYKCLCMALEPPPSISKYAIPKGLPHPFHTTIYQMLTYTQHP